MARPTCVTTGRSKRFDLVTAAYHFLLGVLPFREPESQDRLQVFLQTAARIDAQPSDLDTVLIRCLAVLNEHIGVRLPSLVDLYLSQRTECAEDAITRFARCVTEIIQYHRIGDGFVQQAIEVIKSRHADATFTTRAVAETVGRHQSSLCVAFKLQTGLTIAQYIKRVRMNTAATLLATTNMTIKEIWVRVGYNHPSNFAHDFKECFQINAREFRARTIRPLVRELRHDLALRQSAVNDAIESQAPFQVMIVDDDLHGVGMLTDLFKHAQYKITVAADGASALREAERLLPTVILVEYRLPDMNGVTFLNLLRAKPLRKQPTVALFTADWNVFQHAQQLHRLGASIATKLCAADQIRQLIGKLACQFDVTNAHDGRRSLRT